MMILITLSACLWNLPAASAADTESVVDPETAVAEDAEAENYEAMNIKNKDYYLNINNPLRDDNSSRLDHLMKQTAYSTIGGIGAMVWLWNQPTSFTNWDKRDRSGMADKYIRNVKTKPRFDDDDFVTNYIGHPYAGAIYYVMARQNAFTWYQSFGYSVVMSTFFWEYGLEAFAEVPSSQDLIVTPVVGSMFGEGMHQLKQNIKRNNNTLLGSYWLGRTSMWLLDPLGHFTSGTAALAESTYNSFFAFETIPDDSSFLLADNARKSQRAITYGKLVIQSEF